MKWHYKEEHPFEKRRAEGEKNSQEVSRPCSSDCRESSKGSGWWLGQKEIFGSLRSDSWSVLLPDQKAYSSSTRGRPFLLCQQCHPTHICNNGCPVSGAPWRRLLFVHCIQRRKCVWGLIERLIIYKHGLAGYGFSVNIRNFVRDEKATMNDFLKARCDFIVYIRFINHLV